MAVPALVAHRGRATLQTPENIIPSIEALPNYVEGVELDCRLTSDGVAMNLHDASLIRTTNAEEIFGVDPEDNASYYLIANRTFAQVRTLNAGGGAVVPTVEETLQACQGRGFKYILIDMKADSNTAIQAVLDAMATLDDDTRNACVFMVSNDGAAGARVRALSTEARIGSFSVNASNYSTVFTWMEAVGAEIGLTPPNAYMANRQVVALGHNQDYLIGSSTNNDGESLEAAIEDGADIVLTDISAQLNWWYQGGGDDGPPTPPPPPIDVIPSDVSAIQTDGLTWYAFSAITGDLLEEVPEVEAGTLKDTIGTHESADLRIPLPMHDRFIDRRRVEAALSERRVVLSAVANNVPVWSGWVLDTEIGTDPTARVGCVTLGAYFGARYIQQDYKFDGVDFAEVIRTIVADSCGPIDGRGRGIHLLVDAPDTGHLVTVEYEVSTSKTVRSILDELMAMEDGPEWTIRTKWRDDTQRAVDWILEVRPQIGVITPTPNHTWEVTASSVFESLSKSDATYTLSRTASGGKGANVHLCYSSGEGESKPRGDHQIAMDVLNSGVPIIEDQWQPANDIVDVAELDAYARARLELTKHGIESISIKARYDAYPRIGYDWNLGDTAGWALFGHGHPDGFIGQGRVMGYALDVQSGVVEPLLWNPEDD